MSKDASDTFFPKRNMLWEQQTSSSSPFGSNRIVFFRAVKLHHIAERKWAEKEINGRAERTYVYFGLPMCIRNYPNTHIYCEDTFIAESRELWRIHFISSAQLLLNTIRFTFLCALLFFLSCFVRTDFDVAVYTGLHLHHDRLRDEIIRRRRSS